jgi:glutamate racemase
VDERPIGMLDSGLGGLSILREIRLLLPGEDVLFLADQAHVPYGPRTLEQVRAFSLGIAQFLIEQNAKAIVVACNTASAAALRTLREALPDTPFIGMEPAVKPAAEATRTRAVGVLATPATFQGELFASVVERFAGGVRVVQQTLPGLVERIEAGDLNGRRTLEILRKAIPPLVEQGVDTLVLACTHYPFVIPQISALAGPGVRVIDPAPAIARQTERVLRAGGLNAPSGRSGRITFISSGNPSRLAQMAEKLIGEKGEAKQAVWEGERLRIA